MLGLEVSWISFKICTYIISTLYCNQICCVRQLHLNTIMNYLFVVVVRARSLLFALAGPLSVFYHAPGTPLPSSFLLGLASGDLYQRSEGKKRVLLPLASSLPGCLVLTRQKAITLSKWEKSLKDSLLSDSVNCCLLLFLFCFTLPVSLLSKQSFIKPSLNYLIKYVIWNADRYRGAHVCVCAVCTCFHACGYVPFCPYLTDFLLGHKLSSTFSPCH